MTTNSLPKMTPERSAELRQIALAVRLNNKAICESLSENPGSFPEVISNPNAKKIKVRRIVRSIIAGVPGVGLKTEEAIVTDLTHRGINPNKHLSALGKVQKEQLTKIIHQHVSFF